jgi:hypothetical protein
VHEYFGGLAACLRFPFTRAKGYRFSLGGLLGGLSPKLVPAADECHARPPGRQWLGLGGLPSSRLLSQTRPPATRRSQGLPTMLPATQLGTINDDGEECRFFFIRCIFDEDADGLRFVVLCHRHLVSRDYIVARRGHRTFAYVTVKGNFIG